MRKAAVALALLTFAVASGACAATATAPTRAQYAAIADQVCASSAEGLATELQTYDAKNPLHTDADEQERFVRFVLIKQLRATMAQLRSIAPPDGDGAYLGSMYTDYEHALGVYYQDPLGDSAVPATDAADGRLKHYGMKKCATIVADARKKADALEAAAKKSKSGPTTTTPSL